MPNQYCRCAGPGWCETYRREVLGREYELCSGNCPPNRPHPGPRVTAALRAGWKLQARSRVLRKSLGFLTAAARHAADWFRRVPESVYQERLAVCLPCEHYHLAQCRKCGCGVRGRIIAKARWASERCPLDPPKWDVYVSLGWLPWAIARVLSSRAWIKLLEFANGGPLIEPTPPARKGCKKPRLRPTSES